MFFFSFFSVFPTEHPGYHMSLAKMDSAPSSSVVGLHGLNTSGLGIHHHLIANSEASLLRINNSSNSGNSSERRSFVPRIPPLGRSGSSEKHSSEPKMNSLFDKYKDCDDAILVPGTEALLNDLELRPDEFCVLVLAWKCNAEQMCKFTRSEFLQGCRALKADNLKSIQQRLPEAAAETLARADLFKDLYRFTFRFGLASCSSCPTSVELRSLPIEMAISLWQLVFAPREPPILAKWLTFLQKHSDSVRGISRDTWNMFLNFTETVGNDLSTYDEDEAWPSLFDDFVEYENDQANQNYENVRKDLKEDSPLT